MAHEVAHGEGFGYRVWLHEEWRRWHQLLGLGHPVGGRGRGDGASSQRSYGSAWRLAGEIWQLVRGDLGRGVEEACDSCREKGGVGSVWLFAWGARADGVATF